MAEADRRASVSEQQVGVYLHVPFCERVCPYCDFAVQTGGPKKRQAYVQSLLGEIRNWGKVVAVAAAGEAGGDSVFALTDVRRPEEVEAMVALAVSEYGQLDCASNNAAAGAFYALTPDLPIEQWELAISVTLTGVWLCMKYEIPAMLEAGRGSIVNISSASAVKGEALLSAYSAASCPASISLASPMWVRTIS